MGIIERYSRDFTKCMTNSFICFLFLLQIHFVDEFMRLEMKTFSQSSPPESCFCPEMSVIKDPWWRHVDD